MSKRYRDRWDEARERRLMTYRWPELLHDAYKNDSKGLSDYLRRIAGGELNPLDPTQLNELADLLDRRVHRRRGKHLGRKKGSIPPRDPDEISVDHVVRLARPEVQRMKKRNGGKTPRGACRQAIEDICQRLGDDGYTVKIDLDRALKMLKRG